MVESDEDASAVLLVVLNGEYLLLPLVFAPQRVAFVFRLDLAAVVAHLHGEHERTVHQLVHLHSGTPILGQQLVHVPAVHLAARVVAPVVAERTALEGQQLGEQLRLGLFLDLLVAVAVAEGSFVRVRV